MKTRHYIPLVLIGIIMFAVVGRRLVAQSTPNVQANPEVLRRAVAQRDAAQIGDTYPNPLWILPAPASVLTNKDGTVDARYVFFEQTIQFDLPKLGYSTNLTNGFTLHISNSIVIGKSYSYITLK